MSRKRWPRKRRPRERRQGWGSSKDYWSGYKSKYVRIISLPVRSGTVYLIRKTQFSWSKSGTVQLYLFAYPPLPLPRWLSRDQSVSLHSGAGSPCDGNSFQVAFIDCKSNIQLKNLIRVWPLSYTCNLSVCVTVWSSTKSRNFLSRYLKIRTRVAVSIYYSFELFLIFCIFSKIILSSLSK